MKLSRVAIHVAVAILVVGAVGLGAATAHEKKIKSIVTLNFSGGLYGEGFSGKVSSKKKKCRQGRKVRVRRDGTVVGTDVTNKRGKYHVGNANPPPGTYVAKAKKKVIKKNANHKHVCKKATSVPVVVP